MVSQGDHVQVHVDFASDGSGWSLDTSHSPLDALVVRQKEETKLESGHILLVPLPEIADTLDMTVTEVEQLYSRNVINHSGERGVKLGSVSERYLEL